MTTDKKLKESGWAKGFIRSISLSSGHSHTGIAAFGLGEIIFGLEGQSNRAYESMVTHGPVLGNLGEARSQGQGSWEEPGESQEEQGGSHEEPGQARSQEEQRGAQTTRAQLPDLLVV